ncbi:hypothetical protein BS50DRAFT_667411 [Corynespora cassiicola Philippines]|uniref:Uncharacterized protein n=1 Tax=Corynespora cassiicola Philippines TaxID=1448308 RepID=A0A2T2NP30_CORCC|nr:hypothetical protein BS50DRAFT_667411 [Corynespora cassiicola Philippines]
MSSWNPLSWFGSSPDSGKDLPFTPRPHPQKRKASGDLRRAAKIRRLSEQPIPRFSEKDYENADFYEGSPRANYGGRTGTYTETLSPKAGERRASRLSNPRRGSQTTALKSPKKLSIEDLRFRRLLAQRHVREIRGEDTESVDAEIAAIIAQRERSKQKIEESTKSIGSFSTGIRGIQEIQPVLDYPKTIPPDSPMDQPTLAEPSRIHAGVDSEFSIPAWIPKEWTEKPNEEAWKAVRKLGEHAAGEIRRTLQEPEYSLRDVEVRDTMWRIMDKIERFAKDHFIFDFQNSKTLKAGFAKMTPETVKIIGCVGSGGPSGQYGWRELFFDDKKRQALVSGIVGNVLVEQVFQHWCFGGDQAMARTLEGLQRKYSHKDGFDRNQRYALAVQKRFLSHDRTRLSLPPNFKLHAQEISLAIFTHVKHILELKPNHESISYRNVFDSIHSIVVTAGILSLTMRADPSTVYYFSPVFKELEFDSNYMECFNKDEMKETNPRSRTEWPMGTASAEKQRARLDEPLVQITIMDGLTAYRQGGWETVDSPALYGKEEREYEDGMADQGIRSRLLTHQWAYCRWGRPRKFEGAANADDPKTHGDQWNGGFIEFSDMGGVPKAASKKVEGLGKKS